MTAEIRDASTVVLARDGSAGVEVWLLTRVAQMAFAPGVPVFPGGRVEASDADLPWAGTPAAELALRLDASEREARALVGAAVRETFEETGVLLSVPPGDIGHSRAEIEGGAASFGAMLRSHGLSINASALRPWARWVTPEGEPRRYDTRFFVAALPEDAEPADLTSESSHAAWVRPADAVAACERGELVMMPPTLATLRSVAEQPTVADLLAAAAQRSLQPVRPTRHRDADGVFVRLPDGTEVRLPR